MDFYYFNSISVLVIISYSQQFKFYFLKKKSNLKFKIDFIYGIFFLTVISYVLNFLFPLKYFSLIILFMV